MPRAHTDSERETIRQRLLDVGRAGFIRVGLPKLTIADIAREAGIGKGSFYGFFPNKESLFLAIQEHDEQLFEQDLVAQLDAMESGHDAVVALLLAASTRLVDHPFLRLLLDPATISALTLRVDPQALAAHRRDDRTFYRALVDAWKTKGWLHPRLDGDLVFDVLSAMFVLSTQRELLGEPTATRAAHELAHAAAQRWCPR